MRVESDQFLLSCIELKYYLTWLDALFAAIDVAPALEDRDFPRDQSIPRIQRLRWVRGEPIDGSGSGGGGGSTAANSRRASMATRTYSNVTSEGVAAASAGQDASQSSPFPTPPPRDVRQSSYFDPTAAAAAGTVAATRRLSTTSYPNSAIEPETGKWRPNHRWTGAHDLLYAKLCYAVLNFRSPRRSKYIIMDGKRWFVDWRTGRLFRVLPPAYGEVDMFGPWQTIKTENVRI